VDVVVTDASGAEVLKLGAPTRRRVVRRTSVQVRTLSDGQEGVGDLEEVGDGWGVVVGSEAVAEVGDDDTAEGLLAELKADPGQLGLRTLLEEIAKLERVRGLGPLVPMAPGGAALAG